MSWKSFEAGRCPFTCFPRFSPVQRTDTPSSLAIPDLYPLLLDPLGLPELDEREF